MTWEGEKMRFVVVQHRGRFPKKGFETAYLWPDNWNDWAKFKTLYGLTYFDEIGQRHEIGEVKIGQFAMDEGQMRPGLPEEFESLGDGFFSLGQDRGYYESLMKLQAETRSRLLTSLQDVVQDNALA